MMDLPRENNARILFSSPVRLADRSCRQTIVGLAAIAMPTVWFATQASLTKLAQRFVSLKPLETMRSRRMQGPRTQSRRVHRVNTLQ